MNDLKIAIGRAVHAIGVHAHELSEDDRKIYYRKIRATLNATKENFG